MNSPFCWSFIGLSSTLTQSKPRIEEVEAETHIHTDTLDRSGLASVSFILSGTHGLEILSKRSSGAIRHMAQSYDMHRITFSSMTYKPSRISMELVSPFRKECRTLL